MKIWVSLFLGTFLCVIGLSGVSAQTGGEVVVNGAVTNHTPGGGIPAGAPVTLQFFSDAHGHRFIPVPLKMMGPLTSPDSRKN